MFKKILQSNHNFLERVQIDTELIWIYGLSGCVLCVSFVVNYIISEHMEQSQTALLDCQFLYLTK